MTLDPKALEAACVAFNKFNQTPDSVPWTFEAEAIDTAISAYLAALPQTEPVAIPVGWFLVPEVPTDEQMQAGLYQASHDADYADVCQSYMDMVRTPVDAPVLASPTLAAIPPSEPVGWVDRLSSPTRISADEQPELEMPVFAHPPAVTREEVTDAMVERTCARIENGLFYPGYQDEPVTATTIYVENLRALVRQHVQNVLEAAAWSPAALSQPHSEK